MKKNKTEDYFESWEDNFEDWEADYQLYNNEDWEKLLELRLHRAKNNPLDPYAQAFLGEAYVLNKKYEKAISFMYEWHKKYPDNYDFYSVILDALFSLGKSEDDIEWVIKPTIIKITQELIDECYHYISKKKKGNDMHDLYYNFLGQKYYDVYFNFTMEDLIDALKKDCRFLLINDLYTVNIEKKKNENLDTKNQI
jgi:tetratricopeptide (TPR) repeat protein